MIALSKSFQMPDTVTGMRMAIVGRSGSGKTNTGVVMAEQMLSQGTQCVVIDPNGDWWGLRSKYEIIVLGGEHGDMELSETSGAVVADFVLASKHSVILDMSGFPSTAAIARFGYAFGSQLYNRNKAPLHVFLDEADIMAPQTISHDGGPRMQCLSVWQNIARRGRKRGIGLTMISQRPAVINKDLLTQAEPLFVHQLLSPQDLSAIEASLDYHGQDRKAAGATLKQIAALQRGQCYCLSPSLLQIAPTQVAVRHRHTFDSSAAPTAADHVTVKNLVQMDLNALKQAMKDTLTEADKRNPAKLQTRINELEKQLREKPQAVKSEKTTTVPPGYVLLLRKDVEAHNRQIRETDAAWRKLWGKFVDSIDGVTKLIAQPVTHDFLLSPLSLQGGQPLPAATRTAAPTTTTTAPRGSVQEPAAAFINSPVTGDVPPQNCGNIQDNILRALYWLRDQSLPAAEHVAFMAGYTVSGHFNNTMGKLRSAGLVQRWSITAEGVDRLRAINALCEKPTGSQFREWLRPKLSQICNKLLDTVLGVCGKGERIAIEQLAANAGYEVSGHFNNSMGKCRSVGVLEGYAKDGGVKACDVFYD